ncbi:ligase-associated DNA damage response endonuclease PdeM [Aureimonas fodinaquatilis]
MIQRRYKLADQSGMETGINGVAVVCDPSGVIYIPAEQMLVVSDLHLEKGAAFARRGMMLPPYDTAATLSLLGMALARYQPRRVIALGDSFHDRQGAAFMPAGVRDTLAAHMKHRDWIWIAGNHDPEPPVGLEGQTLAQLAAGGLLFRHEPSARPNQGEIAGHLHPVAKVAGKGRNVRAACFATDGMRMIMPSFGVTTGGMNVLGRAFANMFAVESAKAYIIGVSGIFPLSFSALSH